MSKADTPYMVKVINSYKGNSFFMSSKITIDTSLFLPKIDNYSDRRNVYGKQQKEVSRMTLQYVQEYINLCADKVGTEPITHTTQRSTRRATANYVKSKLNLKDRSKSYFVPAFVWTWIAGKVIAYVIKLVIEHYWPDLVEEWGIDI